MVGPWSVRMHVLGEPCVNICVGNLAFTTTEQDLRELFEPYERLSRPGYDRPETGRSHGFGFVRCRRAMRRVRH